MLLATNNCPEIGMIRLFWMSVLHVFLTVLRSKLEIEIGDKMQIELPKGSILILVSTVMIVVIVRMFW